MNNNLKSDSGISARPVPPITQLRLPSTRQEPSRFCLLSWTPMGQSPCLSYSLLPSLALAHGNDTTDAC